MEGDDEQREALNFTCSHNSSLSTFPSSKVLALLSNQTPRGTVKAIDLQRCLHFFLFPGEYQSISKKSCHLWRKTNQIQLLQHLMPNKRCILAVNQQVINFFITYLTYNAPIWRETRECPSLLDQLTSVNLFLSSQPSEKLVF